MKRHIRTASPLIRRTGLLLLLAVCLVATAQAQEGTLALAEIEKEGARTAEATFDPAAALNRFRVSPGWIAHADAQFAAALASPIEEVRATTMQTVIYIATLHPGGVSLEATVPHLVDIYRLDGNDGHRLMALQALAAIGHPYGMQRLREEVQAQPSARIRALTRAALAEYYGARR